MTDPLGAADLQVHTRASDAVDPLDDIFNAVQRAGLDAVAVTDHDQTRGALIARERAAAQQRPFALIPGSEITSRHGHILGLWIEQPIPAFRSAAATIEAIWRQDGVAVIAHPGAVIPLALNIRDVHRLLNDLSSELTGPDAPTLAIETANPIPSARWRRRAVADRNDRWGLPQTGGSDAHFHEQIGTARTRFPGRTESDLRAALAAGQTVAELRQPARLRDIAPRRLIEQQWRGLTATPRALLSRQR